MIYQYMFNRHGWINWQHLSWLFILFYDLLIFLYFYILYCFSESWHNSRTHQPCWQINFIFSEQLSWPVLLYSTLEQKGSFFELKVELSLIHFRSSLLRPFSALNSRKHLSHAISIYIYFNVCPPYGDCYMPLQCYHESLILVHTMNSLY